MKPAGLHSPSDPREAGGAPRQAALRRREAGQRLMTAGEGGGTAGLREKYLQQVQVSRLPSPPPFPRDITPAGYQLLQFHLQRRRNEIRFDFHPV